MNRYLKMLVAVVALGALPALSGCLGGGGGSTAAPVRAPEPQPQPMAEPAAEPDPEPMAEPAADPDPEPMAEPAPARIDRADLWRLGGPKIYEVMRRTSLTAPRYLRSDAPPPPIVEVGGQYRRD